MKKLIVLFFILRACCLLNARSNSASKWEIESYSRNIQPRKQQLQEIVPRKGSKYFSGESGLKMGDKKAGDQDEDEVVFEEDGNDRDAVFETRKRIMKDNNDAEKKIKLQDEGYFYKDAKSEYDDASSEYEYSGEDYDDSDDNDEKNSKAANISERPTNAPRSTSLNGDCGRPFVKPNLEMTKIVNGQEARPHSWPWQIEIFIVEGNIIYLCGGTIITPSVILTAAHCFFGKDTHKRLDESAIEIVAGEHDRHKTTDGETQVRSVSKLIVHDGYNPTSLEIFNDIALLILAKPLNFNHNISAACLPKTQLVEKHQCYSTGWGRTQEEGTISDVLLQVRLPPIKTQECKKEKVYGHYMKDSMICAGYLAGSKDTCFGDSGGPYVCKDSKEVWTVHGIVSWGEGCARPGKPGLYTRVVSFIDWIKAKIGDLP